MYEFILDMNPISSFAHINWNKILLKFFKLWRMDSWTSKVWHFNVFSPTCWNNWIQSKCEYRGNSPHLGFRCFLLLSHNVLLAIIENSGILKLKNLFKHNNLVGEFGFNKNFLFLMLHPTFNTSMFPFLPPYPKLFGPSNGFI